MSLLLGGIGSFEAGCTLALTLLGAPLEAALTGTLLLRGLTLWLPLIPGGLFAHRDLAGLSSNADETEPSESEPSDQDAPGRPRSSKPYWAESATALVERLGTTALGLDDDAAAAGLGRFGGNRLVPTRAGPWRRASLISIMQEGQAGRALDRLGQRIALRTRVLRNGEETESLATDVVPGDLLLLAAGRSIPADAVVLAARELFVDESALTGEPFPIDLLDRSAGKARREAAKPPSLGLSGRARGLWAQRSRALDSPDSPVIG